MSRSTAGEGRRRRKDVPFHRGEGGTIYRYAYNIMIIMVYKLNLGRRRRKDVPFHRGGGGNIYHKGEGGEPYIVMPII